MSIALDGPRLAGEVEHLFRVAYRLTGHSHDAEDLVQDVCERALKQAPEFAATEDCRRWLLRVLYNRFVDGRRRHRRSPFVAGEIDAIRGTASVVDGQEPEELAARSDAEASLLRAWVQLEPAQQALLLLRAEGYDLDEIALITEIDKPAVSSRLYRARTSLARYLKEEKIAQPLCAISEKAR